MGLEISLQCLEKMGDKEVEKEWRLLSQDFCEQERECRVVAAGGGWSSSPFRLFFFFLRIGQFVG